MFWTIPLSITGSFSLYTQQWYMSYRFCWQLASRIRMETFLIVSIGWSLISVFKGLRESSAIIWHVSLWSNILTAVYCGGKVYVYSVWCLCCLICYKQIHSYNLWTHSRMLTLPLLLLLVTLASGRNNTDKTPWRCPEITQPPAVSCSCDLPHTLRCIGDSSALQVRSVR